MALDDVLTRMRAAEAAAGRPAGSVELIAVSKVQPADRVDPVLAAGHRVFGENRVQEAQSRWPDFQARYDGISLHLIGPLQSNKSRVAFDMFDAIHTLDRAKLGRRFADHAQEAGRCPELFVQINTGAEPQKAGVLPDAADGFISDMLAMDLPVGGLMCIPPVEETPALHFALLAKIAERNGLSRLSMGMSGDFETAIAFGATHIRVGSAVFGARAVT